MPVRLNIRKAMLILAMLGMVAVIKIFDLQDYFTLEMMQEHLQQLIAYCEAHPVLALSLYFFIYVLMAALSLPGAAPLTLLSGALFGLTVGTIVVSFASTIGALLCFLLVRYLFAAQFQTRYEQKLRRINKGFRKEGAFYLFALRLAPIFPFFIINIVMALTPIRAWTYYWVSQVGMLPGTVVYVYAGLQLGKIRTMDDIFTPEVILAFSLLGLFPLAMKRTVAMYRRNVEKDRPDEAV